MSTTLLAIEGGAPLRSAPMPSWPAPDETDVKAVADVVASGRINYWTGDRGRTLEARYAESTGRRHGIAVANGTVALELALIALGVGAGDEVIVPARTFVATASSVFAVGATPVVADIDPVSGNLTAETVRSALSTRTKAVIPVHVGGWPVDLDPLIELATELDIKIIEDCAQAHGARYRGRPVGAPGTAAACFSFCQDKIVPGGEGGIVMFDDDEAFARAWEYKDHGKSLAKLSDPGFMSAPGSFRWLVDDFGTNWRLDEMAAALILSGLDKLPRWHAARTERALRLAEGLVGTSGLQVPLPDPSVVEHGFYRLYAHIDTDVLATDWSRDRIISAIAAEGVPVQFGSCTQIHLERAFAKHHIEPKRVLPAAARMQQTQLAFFVHPTLTLADIDNTATAVRKVMEVAAR